MYKFILIVSAAFTLAACGRKKNSNTPAGDNEVIPVKLAAVRSATAGQQIPASGLLATEEEARLSFKIGGIIERITVREGDRVRKGQWLASLKAAEISAQVQTVQLALEKALRDYQRAENLYRDSVATLEQMQNARTAVDIARQNLQQVNFNRQYANIYAPADGFIVKKLASEGELAAPGSPVLFMSAESGQSKWVLKTGLSDQHWALVETGNKATVSFDAFPGEIFQAVVSKKAPAADPVTGSFTVELEVQFLSRKPALGMFGQATIIPSRQAENFSIPYEALLEANGKKGYVFVSNDRRTVRRVEVEIASITDSVVYISSGLAGYAYVITSGSPYLNEQSVIRVQ